MPKEQAGARYLAELQQETLSGSGSPDTAMACSDGETPVRPATAPLMEVAAHHDGQPLTPWMQMLYRRYGWLD